MNIIAEGVARMDTVAQDLQIVARVARVVEAAVEACLEAERNCKGIFGIQGPCCKEQTYHLAQAFVEVVVGR